MKHLKFYWLLALSWLYTPADKTTAQKSFKKLSRQHRILLRMEYDRQHAPLRLNSFLEIPLEGYTGEVPEAELLSSAFIWSQSKMGFPYWEAVSTQYIKKHFKESSND